MPINSHTKTGHTGQPYHPATAGRHTALTQTHKISKDLVTLGTPPAITEAAAKEFIATFWSMHTSNADIPLSDFYALASSSFTTTSTRIEPARLVAMRRQREYFRTGATMHADVRNLEVLLIEPNVAVTFYTLQITAHKKKDGGSVAEEVINAGRVTQVLALDDEGQLRIVHEHASEAEKEF